VWLSPMPAHTAEVAHHLGFDIERRGLVDVGGLRPELQILRVPERASRSAPAEPKPDAHRRRIVSDAVRGHAPARQRKKS
jgi:hypothetical protein